MSIPVASPLFFRYSSLTCLANFFVFLILMLRCLWKCPILVPYLVSRLHSSPFPRSFPLFRAGRHYSCIPLETSCGCTPCSGINTAAFLYCFFHITTLLCSHNTDTLLQSLPSLFPPFSRILPLFFPLFNCHMTSPKKGARILCHASRSFRPAMARA